MPIPPIPPGAPFDPANSIYTFNNFKTTNTRKLRAALSRVQSGVGPDGIFINAGDSKTAGAGATTPGSYVGAYPNSWPVQLAKILASRGTTSGWNSWFCDHNVNSVTTLSLYDARWTLGAGWLTGGAYWACGPGYTLTNRTTTNVASLVPTVAFDGIEIYYLTGGAFGTFKVDVDSGATLGTYTTAGAESVTKATITGLANTTHTINFTPTSLGNGVFIYGVRLLNSTAPKIDVCNWGAAGSTSSSWLQAAHPWEGIRPLTDAKVTPDCSFIDIQINDLLVASPDVAAYTANMQAIITAFKVSGDVVLLNTYPGNTAAGGFYVNTDGPIFDAFQSALYGLALSNDCPIISLKKRWTSYNVSQPLGYYSDTTVHGSRQGYGDVAQTVSHLILDV